MEISAQSVVSKKGDVDVARLRRAMVLSSKVMEPYRKNRLSLVAQYTGPNWSAVASDNPDDLKQQLLNLLSTYVQIVWRQLVAKNPRVNLSTFAAQYKPTVKKVEEEANRQFEKMNLADTLQRVALDALFSIGITKVGLANPGQAAMTGFRVKAGMPFAAPVSLDDFLFDHHARRWNDCSWMMNRCRIPLWIARDMGHFNKKGREALVASEDPRYSRNGDMRTSHLGRDSIGDDEEAEEMVDLLEVYFPRQKKLITIPDDDAVRGSAARNSGDYDEEPLSEMEWIGADRGPYHILGFGIVPDNVMPLAPLQNLRDMNNLANNLWRKLERQARRMKTMTAYQRTSSTDAEAVKATIDGGMVGLDFPDAVKEIVTGGPHPVLVQFAQLCRDSFNWLSGNIELNAGLAPQSKTAAQDKMLNANSSRLLTDMQETTVEYVSQVADSLCWYYARNPFDTYKGSRNLGVKGMDLETTVSPQERRSVPWDDVDIRVDPYSLRHQTPAEKLAFLDQTLQQLLPLMPLLQQAGRPLDVDFYLGKRAEYGDSPDLDQMFTSQEPPSPEEGGGGTDTGENDLRTLPSDTTRTYERRSIGADNPDARNANIDRMAAAAGASMNGDGE